MAKIYELYGCDGYASITHPLFGVECEIEAVKELTQSISGTWTMTEDGSLRNRGKEFISVPMNLTEQFQAFRNLHASLKLGPDAFSERTSIHVHVNCQGLEEEQVKNIMLLYALFEECFFLMVHPSRRSNIHCVPLTETHMPLMYSRPLMSIVERWHKYTALNLLPLAGQGTIEFRHMHGHNDPVLYNQWLVCIANLMEVGKRVIINKDFLTNKEGLLRIHSEIFRHTPIFDITRQSFDYYMSNSLTDVKLSLI